MKVAQPAHLDIIHAWVMDEVVQGSQSDSTSLSQLITVQTQLSSRLSDRRNVTRLRESLEGVAARVFQARFEMRTVASSPSLMAHRLQNPEQVVIRPGKDIEVCRVHDAVRHPGEVEVLRHFRADQHTPVATDGSVQSRSLLGILPIPLRQRLPELELTTCVSALTLRTYAFLDDGPGIRIPARFLLRPVKKVDHPPTGGRVGAAVYILAVREWFDNFGVFRIPAQEIDSLFLGKDEAHPQYDRPLVRATTILRQLHRLPSHATNWTKLTADASHDRTIEHGADFAGRLLLKPELRDVEIGAPRPRSRSDCSVDHYVLPQELVQSDFPGLSLGDRLSGDESAGSAWAQQLGGPQEEVGDEVRTPLLVRDVLY